MGRFTIFSLEDCPHCTRTKALFDEYSIPYSEISLSKYPHRRSDMLSASDRLTVPQVFLNETHVGGADETINLINGWATDEDWTPLQQYQNFVETAPDPRDPRLQPSTGPLTTSMSLRQQPHSKQASSNVIKGSRSSVSSVPEYDVGPPPIRDKSYVVTLPNDDDKLMTILEMTELLKSITPSRDLKHNLTVYKHAFKASELVDAICGVFDITNRHTAVEYCRDILQKKHQLLNHVVDDHDMKDTPTLYFRLTCYQKPQILNSYRRKWTERVDSDPLRLLKNLKDKLYEILETHTGPSGKVNYISAYKDPRFPAFEEASCELFGIDIGIMKEDLKKAFCINLYNLMIKFAFCKVGIGNSDTARYSFFNSAQFQVGPHVFTFQDLENGILRGNRKAPYSISPPFPSKDIRLALACREVDHRIHFALNCGAKSCPPIKTFTAVDIDEELRIVAMAFCEENVVFSKNSRSNNNNNNNATDNSEITLSKIFHWYSVDFGDDPHHILQEICNYTRGKKRVAIQALLGLGVTPKIKYAPYDWSTDASAYVPFSGGNVKSETSRFLP